MQQVQKITSADVFRILVPDATLREFTQVVLLGQELVLRRRLAESDAKVLPASRSAPRMQAAAPEFTGLVKKAARHVQPKGFAEKKRMRLIRMRLVQIPMELRQKFADEAGLVLPTIESVLAGSKKSHEKTLRTIETELAKLAWTKYIK